MRKEIALRWAEALRSEKYTQGRYALRQTDDAYCCLGVLCDLAAEAGVGRWERVGAGWAFVTDDGRREEEMLPPDVMAWSGIQRGEVVWVREDDDMLEAMKRPVLLRKGSSLAGLNDEGGVSFEDIASYIEANWRRL